MIKSRNERTSIYSPKYGSVEKASVGPLSVGKNHKTKVIKLVHQNQWEHEEKSSKLPEARENADGQVATGLNFAFHDWLTERESCATFLLQSQSKGRQDQILNAIRHYNRYSIENCFNYLTYLRLPRVNHELTVSTGG